MAWQTIIRRGITWDDLEAEQSRLTEIVVKDPPRAFLLISEPEPTFTAGRFAGDSGRLWTESAAATQGVKIRHVSRGGKWTYHGPGQILIYPIVALRSLGFPRNAVRRFLYDFREAIALVLRAKGIACQAAEPPFGLYCKQDKLVSFGIALRRGVVQHGAAVYLSPQSHAFRGIEPCGVANASITSLADLGVNQDWMTLASELSESLEKSLKLEGKRLGSWPINDFGLHAGGPRIPGEAND